MIAGVVAERKWQRDQHGSAEKEQEPPLQVYDATQVHEQSNQ
jgi:hypothetical protein